jgi:hypothetical protein
MPQNKKRKFRVWACRRCGKEFEQEGNGRLHAGQFGKNGMCEPCKKLPAKNPRHGIKRKKGQHMGGRGKVKLRACGCPSRKHRPTCPKSRSFTPPKEDNTNERIAWVNKVKAERKEAARLRKAAKIAAQMRDYTRSMQPTNGLDIPVYLSCSSCNARAPVRDFVMWNAAEKVGICKNCKEKKQ